MVREIPLTQGKVALIDDEDFDKVKPYRWYFARFGRSQYAFSDIGSHQRKIRIYLHTLILGQKKVDHRNGNGLDNRKENLRIATTQQNGANRRKTQNSSSIFKGVSWVRRNRKWQASIKINGRNKFLGYYTSEIDAAAAYDLSALKYFGDFACTNESLGLLERKL